jgi:prepilin signal peptidase PulO-like enzyme (type II secretory pathway)
VGSIFLLGLLVGGLVNHLGTDLAARRAITEPNCPYCGRERPRWQWLSLPVYLMGRHQCVSCGASIRIRYPLVEIGLGIVFGYLWIKFGPSVKTLFYALYSAILALILVTDVERKLILDVVTYPAMALALVGSFFVPGVTWWSALIGGAIGGIFFYIAVLIGHMAFGAGALGLGDVKLAAFVGLITGFPLVIEALVLTMLAGAAISLVLLVTGIRGLKDHIPYGPFLIIGAMITLLWGYPIAVWFLW